MREFDLSFEGIDIHCYEGGSGYPIVMIHGSGPGTASATNWAHVMKPLSQHYRICAMDLVGYGLSGRKASTPYFDVDMWARQATFVLNHVAPEGGAVGMIGHSLGGAITLRTAIGNPRVNKIMLQGSLGGPVELNEAIDKSWQIPKSEQAYLDLYRNILKIEITPEFARDRLALLRKDGYDAYFASMYSGERQRYLDQAQLSPAELSRIACQIFMVTGANDTCCDFTRDTLKLAESLPQADVMRMAGAGHPCSFDQPEKFIAHARAFFG